MPKSSKQLDAEIATALAKRPRERDTFTNAIQPMRKALRAFMHKHAGKTGSLLGSDFEKHDVAELVGRFKKPEAFSNHAFVWLIGTTGTHLVWVDLDKPCPERLLEQVAGTWPASERELFFWDGVALRQFQSVGQLCSKIEDEQGRRSGR